MNYRETIDFLYSTLPMFSRIGSAAIKKDLTNTRLLCEYLGNPQDKFKCIHVAGTNGKGSVSHMLAAVFQAHGFKTGLYTSPHLYDFRERIRINGIMCPEDFVVQFTEQVKEQIHFIEPSFFELTVAMAFTYFANENVDIAIIETGLGGRLDSTNIIAPLLSVITNIGWDHMALLGNSLEEIAGEKAGIIKPNTPVVIGERQPETDAVFLNSAHSKNCDILFAEDVYATKDFSWNEGMLEIKITNLASGENDEYALDLPGIYQAKNLCTTLAALDCCKKYFALEKDMIKKAFSQVRNSTGLMGRWQVIRKKPLVVLDVAHNKNGFLQLLAHLRLLQINRLRMVTGMVKDKDVNSIIGLFPKNAHYYFTQAHIPRALEAGILQQQALAQGLTGNVYEHVNLALEAALADASEDDVIVVCGSIFLVAEVSAGKFA